LGKFGCWVSDGVEGLTKKKNGMEDFEQWQFKKTLKTVEKKNRSWAKKTKGATPSSEKREGGSRKKRATTEFKNNEN